MALSIQTLTNSLSFSMSISQTLVFFPNPTAAGKPRPPPSLTILMGGGPRTFPGGVSKWQWKRMQANKAKQLLKARLSRERQIYEMRKRAELRAAASELERPWEAVEKAPNLLSVAADEQLKVLADRFQRPGGFDMWTDRDGPQIFRTADDLPSARFFPKGVVHSVKPYRREPLPGGESRDPSETSGSDRNRHELDLRNGSNVDKLRRNPNYGLRDNGYKRNVNSSAFSDSEIGNVERNYFENENSKGFRELSNGFRKNGYHEKFESSHSNGLSFSDSEVENSDKFVERRALNSNNSNGFRKNSYQNNSNEFRKNSYQRKLGSSGSNGLSFSDSENENFEEFGEQPPRALNSNNSNGFRKNSYQRKFGSSNSENGNLQDFEEKRGLSSKGPNGNNSNYQRKFESSGGEFGDRGYRNNNRSYDSRFGARLRSTAENSSGNRGFSREQRNQNNNGSLGSESGGFRMNENRPISKNDSRSRSGVGRDRIGSKSPSFRRSESRYNNRGNGPKNDSRSEVFDMDLREDGSYGFR